MTLLPKLQDHTTAVERQQGEGIAADRRTARIVGALFLAAMATYMTGDALIGSVLDDPDYLVTLSTDRFRFAAGAVFMLANSAAVVGIGVLMFPILERHSKRVAVGYLGTRLVESIVLVVGVISLLSLLTVSGLDAGGIQRQALAELAVGANDFAFQIAMFALGLGSLGFCYLLYRTKLIPGALAALGFVGYAALMTGGLLEILGYSALLTLSIPGGLFEVIVAFLLLIKGFKSPAVDANFERAAAQVARRT